MVRDPALHPPADRPDTSPFGYTPRWPAPASPLFGYPERPKAAASPRAAARRLLRFGIMTWMLLIASIALPLHSLREGWRARTSEAWCVAGVSGALGVLGVASALAFSASRRRVHALPALWWVLAFQILGVIVPPDPFGVVLMPFGLVAGGFLLLRMGGFIRT